VGPSPSVCDHLAMSTLPRQPRTPKSNLGGGGHLETLTPRPAHHAIRSCTYHKGAWHTLCGCRLKKKIDRERLPRSTRTPTSADGGEFQKVRVHVSPNNSDPISHRVLVVSENKPPRHGATDSEEARLI
jgi:hypothetical protein